MLTLSQPKALSFMGKILTSNLNSNSVGPCLESWEVAECSSSRQTELYLENFNEKDPCVKGLVPSLVLLGRCEHLKG